MNYPKSQTMYAYDPINRRVPLSLLPNFLTASAMLIAGMVRCCLDNLLSILDDLAWEIAVRTDRHTWRRARRKVTSVPVGVHLR